MRKSIIGIFNKEMNPILLAFIMLCGCKPDLIQEEMKYADKDRLRNNVEYLCSDICDGRGPGKQGTDTAAMYISRCFSEAGLLPFSKNNTFFQSFHRISMQTEMEYSATLCIKSDSNEFEMDSQWLKPSLYSASKEVGGSLVYAGYGIDSPIYNDYEFNNFYNKVVVVMTGEPGFISEQYAEACDLLSDYALLRNKILSAQKNGAVGIIIIRNPYSYNIITDTRSKGYWTGEFQNRPYFEPGLDIHIPVVYAMDEAGILLRERFKAEAVQENIEESHSPVMAANYGIKVKMSVNVPLQIFTSSNVIGLLEGSDPILKKEYIVIGAHYDHDGGQRRGADDNASGTAAVLEMARVLSKERDKLKRSILFIAYAAEEPKGGTSSCTGSDYFLEYVDSIDLPVVGSINLDMIGRGSDKTGMLGSMKRVLMGNQPNRIHCSFQPESQMLKECLMKANTKSRMKLLKYPRREMSPLPFLSGDHKRYYYRSIPYYVFYDQMHSDMHTKRDLPKKLSYKKIANVTDLSIQLTRILASKEYVVTEPALIGTLEVKNLLFLDSRY